MIRKVIGNSSSKDKKQGNDTNELFSGGDLNDWDYINGDVTTSNTNSKANTCEGNTCSSEPSSSSSSSSSSPLLNTNNGNNIEEEARKKEEELRVLFSGNDITDWDWFGSTDKDRCLDKNEQCSVWAELGECETNPRFMLHYCQTVCVNIAF